MIGSPLVYRCIGLEHVPSNGPAVYVANHLGSIGPIQMVLSLPVRLYPWVIGEMVDRRRAPRYLYEDFVHPAMHLGGLPGLFISLLISQLAVSLLRGLGSISVDRNRGVTLSPFRRSLTLLKEGKSVVVFPEDPAMPVDPETNMNPFMCGFVLLAPLYQSETGTPLPFIPAAVSSERKTVAIGAPVFYQDGVVRNRAELRRTCRRLELEIHRMHRSLVNSALMLYVLRLIVRIVGVSC